MKLESGLRSSMAGLWLLVICAVAAGQTPTAYSLRVAPDDVVDGAFTVTIDVTDLPEGPVRFALPAWKPGAYRIENWQRKIESVNAVSGATPLDVRSLDERTWSVDGAHGGALRVTYRSRTSHASSTWLGFEGPATFMYLPERLRSPCTVVLDVPEGWQVATALEPAAKPREFRAVDYDTFADCPIEVGRLWIDEFAVDGVRFRNVYNLEPRFDRAAMSALCVKLVAAAKTIFGEFPFDRYDFIWRLQSRQEFFGGLEHLYCTVISVPMFAVSRSVEEMASLLAHEFFHAWNVKRVRPVGLGPFDYSRKVAVKSLWWCEGVTDYYADVLCVRTGVWSDARYIAELRGQIQQIHDNSAYGRESVESASLAAFEREWMQGGLDFYNFGKILGLLLDVEIRVATANAKSLDDVMRSLNARFALPKAGFTDADLCKTVSDIAGKDMTPWFTNHVSGSAELPIESTLARVGIRVVKEERIIRTTRDEVSGIWPGVKASDGGDETAPRWTVTATEEGCPLGVGDVVLAFGDAPARGAAGSRSFVGRNLTAAMRGRPQDARSVVLRVLRGDTNIEVEIAIPVRKVVKIVVEAVSPEDETAKTIQRDLLGRP